MVVHFGFTDTFADLTGSLSQLGAYGGGPRDPPVHFTACRHKKGMGVQQDHWQKWLESLRQWLTQATLEQVGGWLGQFMGMFGGV